MVVFLHFIFYFPCFSSGDNLYLSNLARWILWQQVDFWKTIHFHSCTKKMASEFQILGYTDIAGFLESNLTKRWQEMDVIFVSLLFSVCCMPSAFIVLSLILSGTHTGCYHSLIFIIHNGDFTITSSYSMWYQTPLHVLLFPQKTSIMSYWILVCKWTTYRQHYCVGLPQITVNF